MEESLPNPQRNSQAPQAKPSKAKGSTAPAPLEAALTASGLLLMMAGMVWVFARAFFL